MGQMVVDSVEDGTQHVMNNLMGSKFYNIIPNFTSKLYCKTICYVNNLE